jgi:YfiH family protein
MSIAVRQVREERRSDVPLFVHPDWARDFPWLVQGLTGREAGNFSMFGAQSAGAFHDRWRELRKWTGARAAVLGRQVHGNRVLVHAEFAAGLLLADDSDGHMTAAPGVLLAVSVADCVPVFVVDAQKRTVAVLHAGWRGTATGIVGRCIKMMGTNVLVHFGPAICGACYEVGAEVHTALGLDPPDRAGPVDLRGVLASQLMLLGVPRDKITTSSWCTRCGDSEFYSHRAGHAERQVAVIGSTELS